MTDPDGFTPRAAAQHEGEGAVDAVDLMRSLGQRAPVYALQDTLTRTVLVVMPMMPTGSAEQVWTQGKVDGLRKFATSALVAPRFIRTRTVTMSGDSIINVEGDHPTYQRARAQPEVIDT